MTNDVKRLARREFLGAALLAPLATRALASPAAGLSPGGEEDNRGRILKSVKWGMVSDPQASSVLEKFQLQQQLGFDGVELDSPSNLDLAEVIAASAATGLPVHGAVDSVHWRLRLSSPDQTIRQQGLDALLGALRDVRRVGGSAVLLVPGQVTGEEETHDDVWERSIVEIRRAIPLASQLGVRILIENVWNGFCEKPELMRDYLDAIGSPWVGAYFDIGNVRKFGPSEEWIRVLGPRIVKLDVKDWGKNNGFCKIGDGDVNWPAVREALSSIGYAGWCTAEVAGGDRQRLAEIAERMNRVLAL